MPNFTKSSVHHGCGLVRVPTNLENLENLELSGNFVNLVSQGKVREFEMVREFFITCHMVRDLLIDELIFACNV